MNSPLPLPDWVPTPGNLRLRRAVRRLDTVIAGLLAETRRAGPDADHLMALLMHARADDDDRLSARDLRDEAVTFLLAGHETTALLLAWTFALLSRHHDVRDRLEAELDDVLGGRAPTAADVGRLEVTGRVLKESLRLYPPAYAFARQATQRVEIGGVAVKKGTTVVVSPWVTHRDPRLFDQPEVFDPDRWLGDLERRLPRCAYFPFGGGPHQCIGAHFAMLEATLVLATIAQRYRLDLEPGVELVPEPLITLRPRYALWVAVRPVERPSLTGGPGDPAGRHPRDASSSRISASLSSPSREPRREPLRSRIGPDEAVTANVDAALSRLPPEGSMSI
jgi:cytochrome P450